MSNTTIKVREFFADRPVETKGLRAALTPQAAIVFDHLLSRGTISAVEAAAVHRIRSLSKRITELQDELLRRFHTVWIRKEHLKDVTGQRYVRYSIEVDVPLKSANALRKDRNIYFFD